MSLPDYSSFKWQMTRSAGGVVIDQHGRVLLRQPAGKFGGVAWTFAKGGIEGDESDPEAALREVEEETGWRCKIVRHLGEFKGSTTITTYYLMTPRAKVGGFDKETAELVWVSYADAVALIRQGINSVSVSRDLKVLALAFKSYGKSSLAEGAWPEVWYHGDPVERTSFVGQRMDRKRGARDLNANGPGIYFTASPDEAAIYGKHIHVVELNVQPARRLVDGLRASPAKVRSLILAREEESRNDMLANWGENLTNALITAINSYSSLPDFATAAVQIYGDIYQHDAEDWTRAMVSIGYDVYFPTTVLHQHAVVYNPKVIKIVSYA